MSTSKSTSPHIDLLQSLHTQVRTLKRVVYALCCLFVAGGVILGVSLQGEPDVGKSVADVVQARKFEVVNGDGTIVGVLATDSTNGGILSVRNRNGTPVGSIATDMGGVEGGLSIFDKSGNPVIGLTPTEFGGALTVLNNKMGVAVGLAAGPSGEGGVLIEDGKGGTLVALSSTTDGEGLVETQNGKGQTLVELGVTTGGNGAVVTQNGKGQKLVGLGATTEGNGAVVTKNGKGVETSRSP